MLKTLILPSILIFLSLLVGCVSSGKPDEEQIKKDVALICLEQVKQSDISSGKNSRVANVEIVEILTRGDLAIVSAKCSMYLWEEKNVTPGGIMQFEYKKYDQGWRIAN